MKFPWLNEESLMTLLTMLVAGVMALFVGGLLILTTGTNPAVAYLFMVRGAVGSIPNILKTLMKAAPIMLTGLGIAVGFKGKSFNMGGEGQLILGAVAATLVGAFFPSQLPGFVLFLLFFIFGFLGGGLWASLPGILKAGRQVNEVITSLMMTYIASLLLIYLVSPGGPMYDPEASGYPMSPPISPSTELSPLFGTSFNFGFFIALLCAFFVYVFFSRTTLGYKVRCVGANPKAAQYGGISVPKVTVIAMFISGGLCGLSGAITISGSAHRLIGGFYPGYGWTGIMVAWLGKLNVGGVLLASVFIGGLSVGVDFMARSLRIPIFLSDVIQGLIVLFVILGEYFRSVRASILLRRIRSYLTPSKKRETNG